MAIPKTSILVYPEPSTLHLKFDLAYSFYPRDVRLFLSNVIWIPDDDFAFALYGLRICLPLNQSIKQIIVNKNIM